MNDYTHYRKVIRDKTTNEVVRIVDVRKDGGAVSLKSNEKLAETIGGYKKC